MACGAFWGLGQRFFLLPIAKLTIFFKIALKVRPIIDIEVVKV